MKHIIFSLCLIYLGGCTSQDIQNLDVTPLLVGQKNSVPEARTPKGIHHYAEQLVRQLLDTSDDIDLNRPVIVGSFLPAETLTPEKNSRLSGYSVQLQESVITLFTQAGLSVTEQKAQKMVTVTNTADIVMSRLSSTGKAHASYFLAGTYFEQEHNLVVNLKLIHIESKKVVAASTDYVPLDLFNSHQKIQIKNSQLYRGEY